MYRHGYLLLIFAVALGELKVILFSIEREMLPKTILPYVDLVKLPDRN